MSTNEECDIAEGGGSSCKSSNGPMSDQPQSNTVILLCEVFHKFHFNDHIL